MSNSLYHAFKSLDTNSEHAKHAMIGRAVGGAVRALGRGAKSPLGITAAGTTGVLGYADNTLNDFTHGARRGMDTMPMWTKARAALGDEGSRQAARKHLRSSAPGNWFTRLIPGFSRFTQGHA